MWNVFEDNRTPERRKWGQSDVSTDFTHSTGVSIGDFKQVNAGSVDEL